MMSVRERSQVLVFACKRLLLLILIGVCLETQARIVQTSGSIKAILA